MKRRKELKIIFCLFLLTFTLSSCEALLHYSGNVYNDKNEPIENAKISLILEKKHTINDMGEKFDTISIAQREKLRKKGVKDNFRLTHGGISEPITLYTDKNGYFKTRSILVGCVFKCPNVQLQIEKDSIIKAFPVEELKVEVIKDSLRPDFIKERKLSIFL